MHYYLVVLIQSSNNLVYKFVHCYSLNLLDPSWPHSVCLTPPDPTLCVSPLLTPLCVFQGGCHVGGGARPALGGAGGGSAGAGCHGDGDGGGARAAGPGEAQVRPAAGSDTWPGGWWKAWVLNGYIIILKNHWRQNGLMAYYVSVLYVLLNNTKITSIIWNLEKT